MFLTDGEQYASCFVAADAALDQGAQRLTSQPFATRRFVLEDAAGKPVAGAAVEQLKLPRAWRLPEPDQQAHGYFEILRELLPRLFASVRSDERGIAELAVLGNLIDGQEIWFEEPDSHRVGRALVRAEGDTHVLMSPAHGQGVAK